MASWDDDDDLDEEADRERGVNSHWDDEKLGFSILGRNEPVKTAVSKLKESFKGDRARYGSGPGAPGKEGVWFRVDFKNLEQVTRSLQKILDGLTDMKPFFRRFFVPAYLQDMQLQFETEGQFVGGWDGLSPSYRRWKEARYPGRLILQRTRKLKNSFSPGGRSKYLQVILRPRSARIETLLPYAAEVNVERKIMIPPRALNRTRYRRLVEEYLRTLTSAKRGSR